MLYRSLVLGYHGCEQGVAQEIASGRIPQHPSANEHDWLGHGLYFWEDSQARAMRWAREHKDIKFPGVLGAIIDLGNCLNLVDAEHLELVKSAHKAYLEFCRISNLRPAQNKGKNMGARFLDRAVFETLHKLRQQEKKPSFDTVRAFFIEGEALCENAGLRSLDHIQICVRDPRKIIGYFLPRS